MTLFSRPDIKVLIPLVEADDMIYMIIRIITNTRPRDYCREVFKNMEIMMLYSQHIYPLILYTVNNKLYQ